MTNAIHFEIITGTADSRASHYALDRETAIRMANELAANGQAVFVRRHPDGLFLSNNGQDAHGFNRVRFSSRPVAWTVAA